MKRRVISGFVWPVLCCLSLTREKKSELSIVCNKKIVDTNEQYAMAR